jgi:hypothetical protein
LDAFGIISFTIPKFLRYYEIAAAVGSLFAVIVGIELTREITAEKSVFTDWDEKRAEDKHTSKQLAKLLTISGFVTVIFIGILRLYELEVFKSIDSTMLNMIQTVLYVLVPFNTVLATALITGEFLKGLYVGIIVLLALLMVVAWILDKIFKVLGYTLPVLVDFLYRIVLALLDVIIYFIFTPVLILISAVSSPFQPKSRE